MSNIAAFAHMGGERYAAIAPELQLTVDALTDCGFQIPRDTTPTLLLRTSAGAFVPDQAPSLEHAPVGSEGTRAQLLQIRSNLEKMTQRGDERALHVAHSTGQLIMANGVDGPILYHRQPVGLDNSTITVAGIEVPYSIEAGKVIEFGMGIGGMFMHQSNLQAERYTAHGIHKTRGEVAMLRGMADRAGLREDQIILEDRGIAHRISGLLKKGQAGSADMIVSCRTHNAGPELRAGMVNASKILRLGGLVLGYGPELSRLGMGYAQVHATLQKDPKLEILVDKVLMGRLSAVHEPFRLVIAQRAR